MSRRSTFSASHGLRGLLSLRPLPAFARPCARRACAASFVISLNLHRRHLSESQRAMVAARLATLPHGVRADTPIGGSATTQEAAAEMLNVGTRSVQRAREVISDAPAAVVAAVDRGDMAVSLAAQVAALPDDEQLKVALNEDPQRMREVARDVAPAPNGAGDDDATEDEGQSPAPNGAPIDALAAIAVTEKLRDAAAAVDDAHNHRAQSLGVVQNGRTTNMG